MYVATFPASTGSHTGYRSKKNFWSLSTYPGYPLLARVSIHHQSYHAAVRMFLSCDFKCYKILHTHHRYQLILAIMHLDYFTKIKQFTPLRPFEMNPCPFYRLCIMEFTNCGKSQSYTVIWQ